MRNYVTILVLIPMLLSFSNECNKAFDLTVAGKLSVEYLPQRWVLILEDTEKDSTYFIERWCDIGATNFRFQSISQDSIYLHLQYGGDDEKRRLYNFEASEQEDENGKKSIIGSFQYDPIDSWKSIKEVNFWWNAEKRIAKFEGLIFRSAYFAPWEDKEKYKVIEDCIGGGWEQWE